MAATTLAPVRELVPARALHPIRVLEQCAAAVLLLALAPAMLAIAIAIWVLSRRSPLIAHLRVGQYGRPLWVLKFRTMWQGRGSGLVERVVTSADTLKSEDDARVTSRLARWCRRYSIDELPQLWQVARGEMSFVGPRPITAAELDRHYGLHAREVLRARPGLTGLWQARGRNRLTYRRRLRLDLFLVRHYSAALYATVLLWTVPRVLRGTDAW